MKVITSNTTELKKHLGTVEISNPLSLTQRKAFSVLLFNAYQDLKNAEGKIHKISMVTFCELLGYESHDWKYLDQQISKLQTTIIEWRTRPDEFGRVNFFSYVGLKNGEYEYRFDPKLEEKLYHPDLYAQINISALSRFESRYAIALYENLARYRPNRTTGFPGGSPQWSLEEFRDLMGVTSIELYQQTKYLSEKIINPSVKEINDVSDLFVKVEKIKKGRSIIAVKFDVKDNPQSLIHILPEPASAEKEAENPLAIEMNRLYRVPLMKAGEWIVTYGEDRFNQVLKMVASNLKKGNLKSPIGYITKCFEQGWQPTPDTQTATREASKAREQKARQQKAKKIAAQEAEKQEIFAERALEKKKALAYIASLPEEQKKDLFVRAYEELKIITPGDLPISKGEGPEATTEDFFLHTYYATINEIAAFRV